MNLIDSMETNDLIVLFSGQEICIDIRIRIFKTFVQKLIIQNVCNLYLFFSKAGDNFLFLSFQFSFRYQMLSTVKIYHLLDVIKIKTNNFILENIIKLKM